MGRKNGISALFFSLIILLYSNLYSVPEDPESLNLSLEALLNIKIVSASKMEEKLFSAPAVMTVIDKGMMERRGYQNLLEILKDMPEFDFELPNGGWVGQYPRVRGTSSLRQIVLLLDGVVQNNINDDEMGRYHLYDLTSIQRVEIITGPASAMYGANTLLGIINLVTIPAMEPDPDASSMVKLSYETVAPDHPFARATLKANLLNRGQLFDGLSYLIDGVAILSNDDGRDSYDPWALFKKNSNHLGYIVPDDGFDSSRQDYFLKIRLNHRDHLSFGADLINCDEGLGSMINPGRVYMNNSQVDNRWHTKKLSLFARYRYQAERLSLEAFGYYKNDRIEDDSGFAFTYSRTVDGIQYPAGSRRFYYQNASRYGADLKCVYRNPGKFSIVGGIVAEKTDTFNEIYRYLEPPSDQMKDAAEKVRLNSFSVYLQARYFLSGQLSLIAGARYDNETFSSGIVNPRFGMVFNRNGKRNNSNGNLILKLLHGEAYRVLPLYQRYNYGSDYLLSHIKPEKVRTTEFEAIYLPDNNLKINLSIWYSRLTDLFIEGTNAYSTKALDENGQPDSDFSDTRTYGFKIRADYKWKQMIAGLSYAYLDGENEDVYYDVNRDGNYSDLFGDLIRISRHKIFGFVNYQFSRNWLLDVKFKYYGRRTSPPNDLGIGHRVEYSYTDPEGIGHSVRGSGYLPAYLLVDLSFGCSSLGPAGTPLNHLACRIDVDNMFDKQYVTFSRTESIFGPRYHPQPGRRIRLVLSYRF